MTGTDWSGLTRRNGLSLSILLDPYCQRGVINSR